MIPSPIGYRVINGIVDGARLSIKLNHVVMLKSIAFACSAGNVKS